MAKELLWKKLSSGKQIANSQIYDGPCFYFGFVAVSNQESWRVNIYNSNAASGTLVEDYQTDANKQMDGHQHSNPVVCSNGLYLDFGTGANRSLIVFYLPQT